MTSTVDLVRDLGGQALDLELAGHEVEDSALGLDPDRHPHDLDVDLDLDLLVEGHLVEVGVQQAVP